MGYKHLYPWQIITKKHGLNLTCKLDFEFDEKRLQKELEDVLAEFRPKTHFDVYHDGGWAGIGLVASGGDPNEDRALPGEFLKTPVLKTAPYMESVIDGFECKKSRVRLLQLQPGKRIYWHNDGNETIDRGNVRLHLPIVTHPDVHLQISHEDCRWKPGELWYGDFSFPHRIHNGSSTARVHMVIDLIIDDYVRGLFPEHIHSQAPLREKVRENCIKWNEVYRIPFRFKSLARKVGFAGSN